MAGLVFAVPSQVEHLVGLGGRCLESPQTYRTFGVGEL
jgi:hypothetical protein